RMTARIGLVPHPRSGAIRRSLAIMLRNYGNGSPEPRSRGDVGKRSTRWSSLMAANPISRNGAAMNLSTFERIGSTLMGTALISRALGRPSLGWLVLAIGGAALLQR